MKSLYTIMLAYVSVTFTQQLVARTVKDLLPYEKRITTIFQDVSPNVVHISSVRLQQDFFRMSVSEVPAGTGSGFLWNSDGYIVTNHHVIEDASKLIVTFKDGSQLRAKLMGVEPRKDIAILKVNLPKEIKFNPINAADSSQLKVGQIAVAIGSPFGLDQTLTTGIISAMGRSIATNARAERGFKNFTIRDMIQTDTAINPGNSGGPLLDSEGKLIGMNTAIYSPSGSSSGIGFAVPSNTIKRIAQQIIKFGRVRQPGIGIQSFPDNIVANWGIEGVIIHRVAPGGPAEQAGLRESKISSRTGEVSLGDRIVAVDGQDIKNFDDLYNALENKPINSQVELTIIRERKQIKVKTKLVDLGEI